MADRVDHTGTMLAVLPFERAPRHTSSTFDLEDIADKVRQILMKYPGLRVLGRQTSISLGTRGGTVVDEIRRYGVTHVLRGSVQFSDGDVQIAAELVECETRSEIWSFVSSDKQQDAIYIECKVAEGVAAALQLAAHQVASGSTSAAACDLYRRVSSMIGTPAFVATAEPIHLLEQAIVLDPSFADAWAALAFAFGKRRSLSREMGARARLRFESVRAAKAAIRHDGNASLAYVALSDALPWGRYSEKEALLAAALARSPGDSLVSVEMVNFRQQVGRNRDALDLASSQFALDPLSLEIAAVNAGCLEECGRHADSTAAYDKILAVWPLSTAALNRCLWVAAAHGDWTRFDDLELKAKQTGLFDELPASARNSYGLFRDPTPQLVSYILKALDEQLVRTGTVSLYDVVMAHRQGLQEEAFACVAEATFHGKHSDDALTPFDGRNGRQIFGSLNRSMRQDVRFVSLCAKLGLCDYWVETDNWPDCATEVSAFYDFKAAARALVRGAQVSASDASDWIGEQASTARGAVSPPIGPRRTRASRSGERGTP